MRLTSITCAILKFQKLKKVIGNRVFHIKYANIYLNWHNETKIHLIYKLRPIFLLNCRESSNMGAFWYIYIRANISTKTKYKILRAFIKVRKCKHCYLNHENTYQAWWPRAGEWSGKKLPLLVVVTFLISTAETPGGNLKIPQKESFKYGSQRNLINC